jgi:hypothetical protein
MKREKFSGMINNLYLLHYATDFSVCPPPEAAKKGKEDWNTWTRIPGRKTPALLKRYQEEMVEHV